MVSLAITVVVMKMSQC